MDEQQQKDVAVFRLGVISDFVTRNAMDRGEQERLLTEKCEQSWQIPHSNRSRLARSTILGGIKAYRQGGGRLESLYPGSRHDRGVSRIIDEETGGLIARLRAGCPNAPAHIDQRAENESSSPGIGLERKHPLPLSQTRRLLSGTAPASIAGNLKRAPTILVKRALHGPWTWWERTAKDQLFGH
jgi:hypothetical protein